MLKKLNTRLEHLFDDQHVVPTHEISVKNEEIPFELVQNRKLLENLSYSFSHSVEPADLAKLFSQLSCFFPCGLLLKKVSGENRVYMLESFFVSGKIYPPREAVSNRIALPETTVFSVLSSPATNIITRFNLPISESRRQKMTCYSIKISDTYQIAVTSDSAEPWASLDIETLQKTLMKINFNL